MDSTVLQQLIDAAKGQHWLAIIAVLALYVRKLASPQSGFPITIPVTWLPTVSAAGGLVYGFVSAEQSGEPTGTAVLGCLAMAATSGFFDGLLTAIFAHNSAPAWARALVGVFDDVAGGGSGKAPASAFGVRETSGSPTVPPAAKRMSLRRWATVMIAVGLVGACLASGAALLSGCGVGQIFGPGSNVPGDLEADASCVAGQLLSGDLDPATVASKCSMQMDQTFSDLWSFLVHALGAKGKLSPAQVFAASGNLAKAVAK